MKMALLNNSQIRPTRRVDVAVRIILNLAGRPATARQPGGNESSKRVQLEEQGVYPDPVGNSTSGQNPNRSTLQAECHSSRFR